ncbi:Rrn11p KNAG_0E00910 [Huiozyma naganishii CBS 8797]|uniref:RNA polymerase I-specific transcription initiation factor RRN11 n=1 Tax=Huiozyma naganishii (strain ATCC MYA-139 / BCRC 22969 / CBS 8797 / KCTC 17520 / NBRC 10181 / NCYC 3082 / Yp74L-3) TaxID=1071383 RepID=J7S6F7_HUIN7|nr:hypothetical protein KNAG_0E00910 [Kazachstania naganishii CBS 8797]CCK70359.1 hypothetical protein KNAG_0E00910 [Kazachstania naganishii CBS 8797]
MFELPVLLGSFSESQSLVRKKLRYRYRNEIKNQYKRIKIHDENGQLTPESSHTELDDHESRSRVCRGRKRRLYDLRDREEHGFESDSSEAQDEVGDLPEKEEEEIGHEERKYFKNHEKPEDLYEVWHVATERRKVPIQRQFVSYNRLQTIERRAKRKMEVPLLHVSRVRSSEFSAEIDGYDVVSRGDETTHFENKHIQLLVTLLHRHISTENWNLAYKVFALLIRMPRVDIRAVWNLGVAILARRDSTTAIDFLEWMHSVYSNKHRFIQNVNHRLPPAFRSGSRTHTAQYTTTWLWLSLRAATEQAQEGAPTTLEPLELLTDKTSELLLTPPYMDDSEVWFIYCSCYFVKADILSRNIHSDLTHNVHAFSSSTMDLRRNEVVQSITRCQKTLHTAEEKSDQARHRAHAYWELPTGYIKRQLQQIEKRLTAQSTPRDQPSSPAHYENYGLGDTELAEDQADIDAFPIEEDNSFLQALDTQPLSDNFL